ncbi:MAG: family 20 glycosylhydrolase [Acidobacteria bacterium]|nr:family 20 glycosylhydrolase [Acidobacteriota bacterium]
MTLLRRFIPLWFAFAALAGAQPLPVRGIHLPAPKPEDMPLALRFIQEALPKEGANLLILEFNYHVRYASHPEVVDADALSLDQVRELAAACRAANVRLIPMINLLGHQSWAKTTFGLLRSHPEFDETEGKYPDNQGIYCRSYCPLHPRLHAVLFDLIDELVDAAGADAFHAGMDEVFLLGEADCPRCRGKNRAELFAGEVQAVHDHLAARGKEMWMWGDRFIDGVETGIGKWEASENQTEPALRLIPKDVVITDWHYEQAHPTAAHFALSGFRVVSSPWRKTSVALAQLAQIRDVRAHSTAKNRDRMLGMLHTTWVGFAPFVQAYFKEGPPPGVEASESVQCFRELFRELRSSR